jgi:ABC-type enterochelin transport system ATPase subunit
MIPARNGLTFFVAILLAVAAGPPGDILSESLLKAVYDIEMGILNVDGRRLIVS